MGADLYETAMAETKALGTNDTKRSVALVPLTGRPALVTRNGNAPTLGSVLADWWLRWRVEFGSSFKNSGLASQSFSRDMKKIERIDSIVDLQCKRLDGLYLNLAVLASYTVHGDRTEFECQFKLVTRLLRKFDVKKAQGMLALCNALLDDAVNYIVPIQKGDDLNEYCERLEALEQSLQRLQWEMLSLQEYLVANVHSPEALSYASDLDSRHKTERLCEELTEKVGRVYGRSLGVRQKAVDVLRVRELMQFG